MNEAVLLGRAVMMLPVAWAAAEVLFPEEGRVEEEAGKLCAGRAGRLWRRALSEKSRRVVERTALVAVYQVLGATAGVAGTVKGGELVGAAGLAGVWVLATGVVGGVLGWVGKEE